MSWNKHVPYLGLRGLTGTDTFVEGHPHEPRSGRQDTQGGSFFLSVTPFMDGWALDLSYKTARSDGQLLCQDRTAYGGFDLVAASLPEGYVIDHAGPEGNGAEPFEEGELPIPNGVKLVSLKDGGKHHRYAGSKLPFPFLETGATLRWIVRPTSVSHGMEASSFLNSFTRGAWNRWYGDEYIPSRYVGAQALASNYTFTAEDVNGTRPCTAGGYAYRYEEVAAQGEARLPRSVGPYNFGELRWGESLRASAQCHYRFIEGFIQRALYYNDPAAWRLALVMGRHLAGQGVVRDRRNLWYWGITRYEKSNIDGHGDARTPQLSHNFGAQLILLAAGVEDSLIKEAAKVIIDRAVHQSPDYRRMHGPRKVARQLENLLAAKLVLDEPDARRAAQRDIDELMDTVQPTERYFYNEDARGVYPVDCWMDMDVLYWALRWTEYGAGERHREKLLDMVAYALTNYLQRDTDGFVDGAAYQWDPHTMTAHVGNSAPALAVWMLPAGILLANERSEWRETVSELADFVDRWAWNQQAPFDFWFGQATTKDRGTQRWALSPLHLNMIKAWED